jgi:exosortase/archaeosortase family protein
VRKFIHSLRSGAPDRFLAAMAVALAFAAFLTADQFHWWELRSDYAFGWLVPGLVVFVVIERWSRLTPILHPTAPSPLPAWGRVAAGLAAGAALWGGLVIFLLGALYRAGAGATQPGSLALAFGFCGILLGLVYFNVPAGQVGPVAGKGWGTLKSDSRLRAAALFLFPAAIWMLSAPLATAVENAVSLFLLKKVVAVVFAVFSMLGYPLVQEGNVLVLPHGQVGVADACSGIRSLTGCLFAGSFLAAVFLDRFWQKVVLVGAALALAFFTNLLRSLFLTSWAYAYGSDAIEGRLHDATGWIVLGLTSIGLFCLLPLLRPANWRRWAGLSA